MLSLPHFLEQPHVFFDGTVAEWAGGARLRGRAFLGGDVLCRLFIHVGLAILNQLDRVAVERLEVIAGVVLAPIPFKTKPGNVPTDGVHVLCVFLDRVCVVKTEVDRANVFCSQPKIHTNRLGVPNVQVAIGLRWKPCVNPSLVQPRLLVGIDDLLNEVSAHEGFLVPLG